MRKEIVSEKLNTETLMLIENELKALSTMIDCVKMNGSCTAEYEAMQFKTKEKYVKEIFKERIQKNGKWFVTETKKRANGETYTLFRARPLEDTRWKSDNSYEGLVEIFYKHYAGHDVSVTIGDIYEPAVKWKYQQPDITGKTMQIYTGNYEKYIAGSLLEKTPVEKVTVHTLTDFYEDLCMKHSLTYKQVQDVRNVMSFLIKYCVRQQLMEYNPVNSIDYKSLPYAKNSAGMKDKIRKTPFTPQQTLEVMEWCDQQLKKKRINPLHPLGIKLGLIIAGRYGELRGLDWADIDFKGQSITMTDQMTAQYEMMDDMTFKYKGRQSAGHMKGYEETYALPLPDNAAEILYTIKKWNWMIFMSFRPVIFVIILLMTK